MVSLITMKTNLTRELIRAKHGVLIKVYILFSLTMDLISYLRKTENQPPLKIINYTMIKQLF